MVQRMQFARRGFRELPGATTRVRGVGDLPYNPRRPLRLPGDRRPPRRPQLNTGRIARLLLPPAVLLGLGVGIFFLVDAVINDDKEATETPAVAAGLTQAAADEADGETPAEQSAAQVVEPSQQTQVSTGTAADQTAGAAADTPAATIADETAQPGIITAADLAGAPVLVERGSATPIPPGIPNRTLADGSPYDPTSATLAFSSVWQPNTVLEITRLPGGPLLSEEDAMELIGKVIRVVVGDMGAFTTELQLSPAAYQLLAREVEPIIALRIQVVAAPPDEP